MYKSKHTVGKRNIIIRWLALSLAAFMIFCGIFSLYDISSSDASADTTESTDSRKLKNGSFEEGQTWTDSYKQPNQSAVPSWSTTAFQEKIELFRENKGVYVTNGNTKVILSPTDGIYAAELNADEESTLYQVVNTSPSSLYEWGLDHGARNGKDTMALIIGPKQSNNPSKPSKEGRDQLMQMVDWLIAEGYVQDTENLSVGMSDPITVYSKKFAAKGTFADNAGNNAFSLTPSTIYTEEWKIWIMTSEKAAEGVTENPWNSFGSNVQKTTTEGSTTESGNTGSDLLSEKYLYAVPEGQNETLFCFVSVGYFKSSASPNKAKTYGNFLDNINFQIYHPLSGSTTNHGSAVINGSDGSVEGEGASSGYEVTVDHSLATYVVDGESLKIQALIMKDDYDEGCEFIGVYYTTKNIDTGKFETKFLKLKDNVIEYSEVLTEEEKQGKWLESKNSADDIIYTYYLADITSATNLHFVFIKSPTVTYDPNGGKSYDVGRTDNSGEAANVYSFKPALDDASNYLFIPPCISHAAEGQNDGWKFMGWLLTGDVVEGIPDDIQMVNVDQLGSMILPAEHTIACDYTVSGVAGDAKQQYFKIYNGSVPLTEISSGDSSGVTWDDTGQDKVYANVHKGITLVAQWRWRQAFIPQTYNNETSSYDDSDAGGTVEITIEQMSGENYNAAYNETGGKSYHAESNELITVNAAAKEGFIFEGWYDENGTLVSTSNQYGYYETKESVKTFYARFTDKVKQTYIRQLQNGSGWDIFTDDTIATLDCYEYVDAVGKPISSTVTSIHSGCKFLGWYDSSGNLVVEDRTLSYTTTGNATYYARFAKLCTQTFIRQIQGDNDVWQDVTAGDDTDREVGSLSLYTHTDIIGKTVGSTGTSGIFYDFVGWFDSAGNAVDASLLSSDGKTISYKTTGDAIYYARFTIKKVEQTYIRQLRDGEGWAEITDDEIAVLSLYNITDDINKLAESTAAAKSGYRFLGWYDSDGSKVSDTMIASDGKTLSYITSGDATYYARFEKAFTLIVSKIDGDSSTEENKVPLLGAEFTLYQQEESSSETIVYNGTSINCIVVDKAETVLNEDSTKAQAVFADTLTPGVYYLVETRAPTGYQLHDTPYEIVISDSGDMATIDGIVKAIEKNEVSIELANYFTLHMPTTGIALTAGWFAAVGLTLLVIATLAMFRLITSQLKGRRH